MLVCLMSLKVLSSGLSQMKTFSDGPVFANDPHFVFEVVIVIIDVKKTWMLHFRTLCSYTWVCCIV